MSFYFTALLQVENAIWALINALMHWRHALIHPCYLLPHFPPHAVYSCCFHSCIFHSLIFSSPVTHAVCHRFLEYFLSIYSVRETDLRGLRQVLYDCNVWRCPSYDDVFPLADKTQPTTVLSATFFLLCTVIEYVILVSSTPYNGTLYRKQNENCRVANFDGVL